MLKNLLCTLLALVFINVGPCNNCPCNCVTPPRGKMNELMVVRTVVESVFIPNYADITPMEPCTNTPPVFKPNGILVPVTGLEVVLRSCNCYYEEYAEYPTEKELPFVAPGLLTNIELAFTSPVPPTRRRWLSYTHTAEVISPFLFKLCAFVSGILILKSVARAWLAKGSQLAHFFVKAMFGLSNYALRAVFTTEKRRVILNLSTLVAFLVMELADKYASDIEDLELRTSYRWQTRALELALSFIVTHSMTLRMFNLVALSLLDLSFRNRMLTERRCAFVASEQPETKLTSDLVDEGHNLPVPVKDPEAVENVLPIKPLQTKLTCDLVDEGHNIPVLVKDPEAVENVLPIMPLQTTLRTSPECGPDNSFPIDSRNSMSSINRAQALRKSRPRERLSKTASGRIKRSELLLCLQHDFGTGESSLSPRLPNNAIVKPLSLARKSHKNGVSISKCNKKGAALFKQKFELYLSKEAKTQQWAPNTHPNQQPKRCDYDAELYRQARLDVEREFWESHDSRPEIPCETVDKMLDLGATVENYMKQGEIDGAKISYIVEELEQSRAAMLYLVDEVTRTEKLRRFRSEIEHIEALAQKNPRVTQSQCEESFESEYKVEHSEKICEAKAAWSQMDRILNRANEHRRRHHQELMKAAAAVPESMMISELVEIYRVRPFAVTQELIATKEALKRRAAINQEFLRRVQPLYGKVQVAMNELENRCDAYFRADAGYDQETHPEYENWLIVERLRAYARLYCDSP